MERQGNLSEVSIKKSLRWFMEEKATGKITFSLGTEPNPITATISFKDGKPTGAQIGLEKGQRALGQILNSPSVGSYRIETEETAVLKPEELPTIAPFARAAAPVAEPEPTVLFEPSRVAAELPPVDPLPMAEEPPTPAPSAPPEPMSPPAPASPSEKLAEILRGLQRRDYNIQASAVVSKDGLIVASILPREVPQDRVAVTAAAIVAQAQSATSDLVRGNFQDIFIRGEGGYICVTKAGETAYLLTLAKGTAMLGSILLELKKTADEIAKEL